MPVTIPTRTDWPHYALDCPLDGTTYHLDFDWNDRDNGWYLSISTPDGTPLVSGRRLVLNFPLFSRYGNPQLSPGVLIAIDTTNTGQEPGVSELGTRVQLVYLTAAEVAELAG